MNKYLLVLVTYMLLSIPAYAQLGRPQTGVSAPSAFNYFRVAIIPKQEFKDEFVAKAAACVLTSEFGEEMFKFKIIKLNNHFRVAMLVKIMFFEKAQAQAALNFLAENPQYDRQKYDLEVVSDSSY